MLLRKLTTGLPSKKITTVILDWSGTTIDALVKAPAVPFQDVFKKHGVTITNTEARLPMGLPKDQHIRQILQNPAVADRWKQVYGRESTLTDAKNLFDDFLPMQLKILSNKDYIKPLPNVIQTLQTLKKMGIKIGLTSGFNCQMTQTILDHSRDIQLESYFDTIIPADHPSIKRGRPHPDAVMSNMISMGCEDVKQCIKVDDTQSGIYEGQRAGVLTMGLTRYNNFNGMYTDDIDQLEKENPHAFEKLMGQSYSHLEDAKPDYIGETLTDLVEVINKINHQGDN